MKFKEIVNRLTGISTPVFGVQWNPLEADITKARRVISFLEDRRVLFNPSEMETPAYCVRSVIEMRRFLTTELSSIDEDSELSQSIRAMRAACRKFLDTVEQDDRRIITFGAHPGHYASWIFMGALGEMRGVFGIQIAKLAAQHGLDVEDNLATILPASDDSERD
ncbi:MAG: hypothetical protein M3416_04165 [Acidobacteriota bacterium]|nr:hypothetical protein [Acidobacteriota bacterium]